MPIATLAERQARQRQLTVLREPALWPRWPFLPVVRRTADGPQFGLLVDARRLLGLYGYSATVFRVDPAHRPPAVGALLSQPREVFDTAEEVHAAGWRVD